MLEIYNDSLNDLLTKSSGATLDIRVQGKSVSVPGLTQVQVQTEADILNVMETGEKNRKIASTKMNIQRSVKHRNITDSIHDVYQWHNPPGPQLPLSPGGGAGGGGFGRGFGTDVSRYVDFV